MTDDVKADPTAGAATTRRSRAEQAAATRRAVLDAARVAVRRERGYTATTVGADRRPGAGFAVDTVYASVGRKPALLRELVETAISGTDEAVPAEQRDYVQRYTAADTAREKMTIYAEAITAIQIGWPRFSVRCGTPRSTTTTARRCGRRSATAGPGTCCCWPPTARRRATCAKTSTDARSPTSSGA